MLVVFVLVNAVVWVYGLLPTIRRVDALRDDLAKSEQHHKQLVQQFEQLEAIDAEALAIQFAAVNLRVPELSMLREFVHHLLDLAEEMSMPLPGLSIGTPTEAEPYFAVTLTTSITGSYEKIKAFLIALEEQDRLILVKTYSFTGQADSLNCSVSFTIFAEEYDSLTPCDAPGRNNPFREH